jgi:hypothetical protein
LSYSVVDICNLALTRIGHGQISSLDEDSKAGDLCTLHYPMARDALLAAHPWNFAIRRQELAASADYTPAFEFDYYFPLPTDCLKVIRTDFEASGSSSTAVYGFPGMSGYVNDIVPYRLESHASLGRVIACSESTLEIEYTAKVTDTAQFDELFVDLLAQRLAAEMCVAFTDTQSLAKSMWEIYQAKLVEARLIDAQQGSAREIVDLSPWLQVRV